MPVQVDDVSESSLKLRRVVAVPPLSRRGRQNHVQWVHPSLGVPLAAGSRGFSVLSSTPGSVMTAIPQVGELSLNIFHKDRQLGALETPTVPGRRGQSEGHGARGLKLLLQSTLCKMERMVTVDCSPS